MKAQRRTLPLIKSLMKKEKAQGPTIAKEIIEIEGIIEIGNQIIRTNSLKIIQQTILLYPTDKKASEKPLKDTRS